jgi:hypothetical protein
LPRRYRASSSRATPLPPKTEATGPVGRAIAFSYLAVAGRFAAAALSALLLRYPFRPRPFGSVGFERRPDARRIVSRAPDGAQQDVRLAPVANTTAPAPTAAGGIWPRGQVLAGARDRSHCTALYGSPTTRGSAGVSFSSSCCENGARTKGPAACLLEERAIAIGTKAATT